MYINICIKLTKMKFQLLMKIWDSVYIYWVVIYLAVFSALWSNSAFPFGLRVFYFRPSGFYYSASGFGLMDPPRLKQSITFQLINQLKQNIIFSALRFLVVWGNEYFGANWSIRPNSEGRIIRKLEGRITDKMAE